MTTPTQPFVTHNTVTALRCFFFPFFSFLKKKMHVPSLDPSEIGAQATGTNN
jgi:hypothetical protein